MSALVALAHVSIAEIPEDKLVDRIVADPLWGSQFFHFAGMPSGMVNRQSVPLATAPGNPKGDIDVLFSAPNFPDRRLPSEKNQVWNHSASQRNSRQTGGV
jgi:hypothetical protein